MPVPNFIIIGAQKSASRWLRINLGEHPEVFATIGHHYFNSHFKKGRDWYSAQFEGWDGESFVGESSPSYMIWRFDPELVANRINDALPEVKLLAIIRNPVDRAYSAFIHHMLRGRIPEDADLLERVRSVDPEADQQQLICAGWYGASLEPYFKTFDGRLQVIVHDDVKADDRKVYAGALEHIGATPGFVPKALSRVIFSRKPPPASPCAGEDGRRRPLTPEERAELYSHFAEDIERLESLLGRDLSIWRP